MSRLPDRIVDKIQPQPDGCWLWTGELTRNGYGRERIEPRAGSRRVVAHRLVYELLVGPIPEGLQLDHLCRNRACVNPEHMEPVTGRINTLRSTGPSAINASKTACVNGHALDERNTYVRPDGTGRHCKACARERNRIYMRGYRARKAV